MKTIDVASSMKFSEVADQLAEKIASTVFEDLGLQISYAGRRQLASNIYSEIRNAQHDAERQA